MRILSIKNELKNNKKFRTTAKIYTAEGVKEIWYEVPYEHKMYISNIGNHWLIIMFMLCMVQNDNYIYIDLPIDELLLKNLNGYYAIYSKWFKLHNKQINVDASKINRMSSEGNDVGLFYSGGVDSMFSLIYNYENENNDKINYLLTVFGFDIPLTKETEFNNLFENIKETGGEFNKHTLPISTNLRSHEPFYTLWGKMSHAAALASIAHLLSCKFKKVYISSTRDYAKLIPWGSHPLTDPLLSSENLSVVHDGAAFTRTEKVCKIVQKPIALSRLHVCYNNWDSTNCSICNKCIRTMLQIIICDAHLKNTPFDWSKVDFKNGFVYLNKQNSIVWFEEILNNKKAVDHPDVIYFCKRSISFTKKRRILVYLVQVIGELPFIWRFRKNMLKKIKKD